MSRCHTVKVNFWCALAIFISGCTYSLPHANSATITKYVNGQPVHTKELNKNGIDGLNRWFDAHNTGWSPSFTTYAPSLKIIVEHPDGGVTVTNVLQGGIIVNDRSGQHQRDLTPFEFSEILKITEEM